MVASFPLGARMSLPGNELRHGRAGKMVTGNEVSARWVVGRLLGVSQRAEIRSLSPHFR